MANELLITVKGGKVMPGNKFREIIEKLADGDYAVEINPYRVRSQDQNEYYWGVVVPLMKDGLNDAGYMMKDNQSAHEFVKKLFLEEKKDPDYDGLMDSLEKKKLTTTTLSTIQFNNYLERIKWYAAEYLNMHIPDPIKPQQTIAVATYDSETDAVIIEPNKI